MARQTSSSWRLFLLILVIAALIRLALLTITPPPLSPEAPTEAGRTAISLAATGPRKTLPCPIRFFRASPPVRHLVPYFPRYRVHIGWILLLLAGHALAAWFSTPPSPSRPNVTAPSGR
jgi:hypothetical protein